MTAQLISFPSRTISPHFQRSINLTYDAGNADYISGYIPTPNGVKALVNILANTTENKTQRAHVLHAPYGSGKSLLGLLLSAIVATDDADTKEALKVVTARIERNFPDEAKLLQEYQASKRRLLPVLLSGDEGDLTLSLTRALSRTLLQMGLGDLRPRTQFQAALSTVDLWEKIYPGVYHNLEVRLQQEQSAISDLRRGLGRMQVESLSLFERLYPDLAAGARFDSFTGQSLADAFHHTAAELRELGYDGILIIWDEFGRFIEAKVGEAFGAEAALLQSFAEFCNRSGENQVHLTLITHRMLAGYAAQLPLSYQQEWSRIAERFQAHDVSGDPQITYRLIAESLTAPDETLWQTFTAYYRIRFDELTARSLELALFSELDDAVLRQRIIERVWPLHPLTVYALPRLSAQVAQNERTLFTFLAADEPDTLLRYLETPHPLAHLPDGWWTIGPDKLWDYFADAIRADAGPGGSHAVWSGVMYALGKIPADDPVTVAIIKALGVLLVVGDVNTQLYANGGRITPTTELLAWSLGLSETQVTERLESLMRKRALRFRRADGYWTFAKGSDVDLEAEIAAVIERKNPSSVQMRQLLEQNAPLPFLLPRGYNLEHKMTRFFQGVYRWADELKTLNPKALLQSLEADGLVVYVITNNQAEQKEAQKWLAALPPDERVIFVLPEHFLLIMEPLRELFALRELQQNSAFMQQDERLSGEIAFFIEDAQRRLQQALRPLTDVSAGKARWHYFDGQKWQVKRYAAAAGISRLLSQICRRLFNRTPILNNEPLNQQSPSGQQARAAIKVADALLGQQKDAFPSNLGLTGYGPDYLIFRTLLVAPGLLQPTGDEETPWQLLRPAENEALARVWDAVQQFLDSALEEEQEASRLISLLQSPPYGLRRGVLPVLLAAMFKPRLRVLTIKRNRKAISPVTGQVLHDLCRKPEQFTLEVGPWDERRAILWEVLQEQVQSFMGVEEWAQQPLNYLSVALLRWLQAQPRFCRDTGLISADARRLRNLIRQAQRNPAQVLLYDLLELLSDARLSVNEPDAYRKALAERLTRLMDEIAAAYHAMIYQLDLFARENFAADAPTPQHHGQQAIAYWLTQLERQLDEPLNTYRFDDAVAQKFIQSIAKEQEAARFWERLADAVIGVPPRDWNDKSIETFKRNLLNAKERLERELLALTDDETAVELSVNIPGEGYHTYRFRPSALSPQGKRLLQNFKSTLEIAGRPLSPDERRQVALTLLHHVLEE